MKTGLTLFGYKAEIEITFLQKMTLADIQAQVLAFPDIGKLAATLLTLSVSISISKVQED